MSPSEVMKLDHGLYRIFWTDCEGSSVAAIGSDSGGNRWMAPTNWVVVPGFDWSEVLRVEKINDFQILEKRKPFIHPQTLPTRDEVDDMRDLEIRVLEKAAEAFRAGFTRGYHSMGGPQDGDSTPDSFDEEKAAQVLDEAAAEIKRRAST